MNIEKVEEAVRVFAVFSGGEVNPVRFQWGGRELDVYAINGRWMDRRSGGGCTYHYSVQSGDETYFLHFSSGDLQWWLDQVVVA